MKMRNGMARRECGGNCHTTPGGARRSRGLRNDQDGRINARMTSRGKDQDKTGKPPKPAGRDARLAAALRENLRRRKAQERGARCARQARPGA